jgi:hypothetical protein
MCATDAERSQQVSKQTTGLYHKFNIERTDGESAAGKKHDGCDYFVLDLTHDPFAMPALLVYAKACREMYPLLAADLDAKIQDFDAHLLAGPDGRREEPANGLKHAATLLAKSITDEMIDSLRADYGNTNAAVLLHWRDETLKALAGPDGRRAPDWQPDE